MATFAAITVHESVDTPARPSAETSVIDTKILLRTLFTSDVLKIRFKIELVV